MANDNPNPSTRWKPGYCPNPGGISKERKALVTAVKEYMAKRCKENVDAIFDLAENADSSKVRLSARIWLAEQVLGKAVQAVSDPEGNPLPSVDVLSLLQRLAESKE